MFGSDVMGRPSCLWRRVQPWLAVAVISLVLVSFTSFYRYSIAPARSPPLPPPRWTRTLEDGWPFLDDDPSPAPRNNHIGPSAIDQEAAASPDSWVFIAERDAENYGLTVAQCQSAFPLLYDDIDRMVQSRMAHHITVEELNSHRGRNGMVRGLVYDGDLLIVSNDATHSSNTRVMATLQSLHRALVAASDRRALPNVEFVFTIDDFGDGSAPMWTYSKKHGDDHFWLMPDFGYWSWPEPGVGSYGRMRRLMARVDDGEVVDGVHRGGLDFAQKIPQIFWRGAIKTAPALRKSLVRATRSKAWANVSALDWDNRKSIQANLVPMEDHCRYMFLAHTEGRSFSGRAKYLHNCRSVVVAHKLEWMEAHHAALRSSGPHANFVEVERDYSDLEVKIQRLLDRPHEARRIADNGVDAFRDRYLTPAAEACYWRRLLVAWRSVTFEPRLYRDNDTREWRGVPFESFVLTGKLHWDAH